MTLYKYSDESVPAEVWTRIDELKMAEGVKQLFSILRENNNEPVPTCRTTERPMGIHFSHYQTANAILANLKLPWRVAATKRRVRYDPWERKQIKLYRIALRDKAIERKSSLDPEYDAGFGVMGACVTNGNRSIKIFLRPRASLLGPGILRNAITEIKPTVTRVKNGIREGEIVIELRSA